MANLLHMFMDYQVCGPIILSIISKPQYEGHKLAVKGPWRLHGNKGLLL